MKRILSNVHIGRILYYSGSVQLDGKPISSKAAIFVGSKLSTQDGSIHIALGRETIINLGENSIFKIVRYKQREDSRIIDVAGMLIEGKIQGIRFQSKNGQLPISIINPRGELTLYGGRFSVEVPPEHKARIKLLSLDSNAKLTLLSPQEFVSRRRFPVMRRGEERKGLGIGLITNPVKDPNKDGQSISMEALQLIQVDFSSNLGSLYVVPLNRKQAFEEYNSKISVPFEESRKTLSPMPAENFRNVETFNLIPTFDHVVNSNFSNATIRLEL